MNCIIMSGFECQSGTPVKMKECGAKAEEFRDGNVEMGGMQIAFEGMDDIINATLVITCDTCGAVLKKKNLKLTKQLKRHSLNTMVMMKWK